MPELYELLNISIIHIFVQLMALEYPNNIINTKVCGNLSLKSASIMDDLLPLYFCIPWYYLIETKTIQRH